MKLPTQPFKGTPLHQRRPKKSEAESEEEFSEEQLLNGVAPKCATVERKLDENGHWVMDDDGYTERDLADLVSNMGVSGYAAASREGWEFKECIMVWSQSFTIQVVILLHIYVYVFSVAPRKANTVNPDKIKLLPLMGFAILLHFVTCVSSVPFVVHLFAYFHDIRKVGWERCMGYIMLSFDGFIIPLTTLTLGTLFLCTSETGMDVVLNSCAVSFISDVDNYLLALMHGMTGLQGIKHEGVLKLPQWRGWYNGTHLLVLKVPVIPVSYTLLFMYLGSYRLGL